MTLAGKVTLGNRAVDNSEEELVIRAQGGDHIAWETIVRSHQEHIFRLAYLILQDSAEAEDMAQDTFIRAFLKLESFQVGRPVGPWLTRIAINLSRNRRRAMGRYLNHLRSRFSTDPEPERDLAGLEQAIQARWQAQRLWVAVRHLSPIRQEVIYLRFFLEMTEAEMAEALDVRPGTIKSRLHRTLAQLRRIIEADFPDLKELFE